MKTYIPENLAYLVKKTGCSQDEFGAIFGLKRCVLRNYIFGECAPKLHFIIKICSHFEVSIDDFIYKSLEEENLIEKLNNEPDGNLLKKQSQLIDSLQEEIERLNKLIVKMRSERAA